MALCLSIIDSQLNFKYFFLCLIRNTISQFYGCHDITFHTLSFQENQLDHILEEIVSVEKFSFYPSRFFSWSNK